MPCVSACQCGCPLANTWVEEESEVAMFEGVERGKRERRGLWLESGLRSSVESEKLWSIPFLLCVGVTGNNEKIDVNSGANIDFDTNKLKQQRTISCGQ